MLMPLLAHAVRASSSASISPTGVALGVAEAIGFAQAARVRLRIAMAIQFKRMRCMGCSVRLWRALSFLVYIAEVSNWRVQ